MLCISRESVEIGLDVYAVILTVQRKGGIEKLSKEKDTEYQMDSEQESDHRRNEVEMQDRRSYNTGASHVVKPSVGHLGVQERPSEESEGEQSNRRGGFESAANRRINKPQPPRAD